MSWLRREPNGSAKGDHCGLKPETHAKGWHPWPELQHVFDRPPGVLGAAWTGGDHKTVGGQSNGVINSQRIVAVHDRIATELTEVLGEVVGERVVIVEDQNLHEMVPPESRRVLPIQS
jgi:hypothetical protein